MPMSAARRSTSIAVWLASLDGYRRRISSSDAGYVAQRSGSSAFAAKDGAEVAIRATAANAVARTSPDRVRASWRVTTVDPPVERPLFIRTTELERLVGRARTPQDSSRPVRGDRPESWHYFPLESAVPSGGPPGSILAPRGGVRVMASRHEAG